VRVVRERFGRVGHVFELCSGPGFIGFSLLAHGLCDKLTLSDINPAAIAACTTTIRENRLAHRVTAVVSDGLTGIGADARFDLVVCNPPHYDGSDDDYRKSRRLVDPGFVIHRSVYAAIGHHLNPGGAVLFQENGQATCAEQFADMIAAGGLEWVDAFTADGSPLPRPQPRPTAQGLRQRVLKRLMFPFELALNHPVIESLVKDNRVYQAAQHLPLLLPPCYFVLSRRPHDAVVAANA
jgi:predicted RNA methylase